MYGAFRVATTDGRLLAVKVKFVVADVRRPLISVPALLDQGYETCFGAVATVTDNKGSTMRLERRGNAFFLPATMEVNGEKVAGEISMASAASSGAGPAGYPSGGEQLRHSLTHLPYAAWCESCVTGRGQEEQHRKRHPTLKHTPTLAMDYCFLAIDEKDAETATALVIKDEISSYTGAAVVTAKGPTPYSVSFLESFFDEVGYPRVILQSDGEPAITST